MSELNKYLYYKDELTRLFCGDAKEILKSIPDNYVDCIVTDPPYGISFMGKEWDKALPSIEIWKECLRVLKPGAFAFVMSIPRTDCQSRMAIMLENAGFDISFTSMFWSYASGFPKSLNISKAVDRKLGYSRDIIGQKIRGSVEKGKKNSLTFAAADANKNNTAIFGYGVENITVPMSSVAKELNGSYAGFQPKPAVEIIIVAMKPLNKKTYVEQALDNKHGITWLDNCRIPYKSEDDKNSAIPQGKITTKDSKSGVGAVVGGKNNIELDKEQWVKEKQMGRFPANLLVSDDILDIVNCGDSASFSRYFSLDAWFDTKIQKLPENIQKTFPFLICPKAAKSEKNKGCEDLPKQKVTTMEMRKQEQLRISGNPDYNTGIVITPPEKNNIHPTVKPLKLMSYLITLGSDKDGIILDPFVGSGTTCVSAKMLKRKSIGCEINKEYCEISKKRLESVEN